VNGDISGTLVSFACAAAQNAYAYGLQADANGSVTVSGDISGKIAALGSYSSYGIYGGSLNITVSGLILSGSAQAGTQEETVLSMINNTEKNRSDLISVSADRYAVYSYQGTSNINLKSGAEIYGKIKIASGTLNVSTGAYISGKAEAGKIVISADTLSGKAVFANGWSSIASVTINVDNAADGVYLLAEKMTSGS